MVSANNGGGDGQVQQFGWTGFYMAVADALLRYRDDRRPLADAIAKIATPNPNRKPENLPFAITDQFADNTSGPLRDICPFTTMGLFNRGLKDDNRRAIASELAEFLQVAEPVPTFSLKDDGVPQLLPRGSWYFHYAKFRNDDAIPTLWQLFADALRLADSGSDGFRTIFEASYDAAIELPLVGVRKLTMALYWMRPWFYPSLDKNCQNFITQKLSIELPNGARTGSAYLALVDQLSERFCEFDCVVHSFQELTWAAFQPTFSPPAQPAPSPQTVREPDPQPLATHESESYTIDSIIDDGCFLDRARLETMRRRLVDKQNIILQGPPGTGKTWLAKRLAYALVGSKDDDRVRPVQFHPNMSYEDFVRGWRPVGGDDSGRLQLVDGPFLELCEAARNDTDTNAKYVMVIEEINRGNPAQIFGEMLTLLESDKRNAGEAMALAYQRSDRERVYIPPNVYVIGTMNVADRSLALVDFALRRRFAFFDLEPTFGEFWRNWVGDNAGIPDAFLADVERRLTALNAQIAADRSLGRQFRIGHSVVTPPPGVAIGNPAEWFGQVVESEIAPLLDEYWFDDPATADAAKAALLAGLG